MEYKGGRAAGTLACNEIEYLRVALTRIAKDPTGPKELRIVVDPDATLDRVKVMLEACQAAGFRGAKVSGLIPAPADPLTPGTVDPSPGLRIGPSRSTTY